MSNLLAGTGSITVDGTTYMVEGDVKYKVSRVKRETQTGYDGVHGFKETYIPGSLSMRFRDSGGLVVANFNSMTDVTVVLSLANKKVVTGKGMWSVDDQEVDAMEATFDVKFEGPSVMESPSS
ncbi:TPA: phage tail tube protein [Burkholderia contaminans]|uniref:phage tail tube protein n=1 Tax=Burkholderia contaminans TaxID=488447 RepID=UPI000CFE7AB0|nr:phage tail tube protein [Burkholderia contaminans]MCA7876748.1 phage tail tube protein [Burkholderia contaminans]MDN8024229.1 phage tail tube protein [Burkholderia contaminans]PRG14365.1 phage tail protein [Burkholderia contaminans]